MARQQQQRFTQCAVSLLICGVMLLIPLAHGQNNPQAETLKRKQRETNLEIHRLNQNIKNGKIKSNQVTKKILKNQRNLYSTQRSLNYTNQQLLSTKTRILDLTDKINETENETNTLSQNAGARLRSLYMGDRLSMLSMLLDSQDIPTLLDRIYYKQKIVSHDKKILNSFNEKAKQLNTERDLLAMEESRLNQNISTKKSYERSLQYSIQNDKKLKARIQNDINAYKAAQKKLEQDSNAIEAQLRKLLPPGKSTTVAASTGIFAWPCVGRISSPFGMRTHPRYRTRRMHTGLDIAKPSGTPIKATDGGKVIESGWRGGYGNVVMINHGTHKGKSIVSLYGHMKKQAVRKGQKVSKGQVIGYVGTTGVSTGPHLHFEIRENGRPVNPRKYLP